jgi:tetratricopeptide (TPR) repeat protein
MSSHATLSPLESSPRFFRLFALHLAFLLFFFPLFSTPTLFTLKPALHPLSLALSHSPLEIQRFLPLCLGIASSFLLGQLLSQVLLLSPLRCTFLLFLFWIHPWTSTALFFAFPELLGFFFLLCGLKHFFSKSQASFSFFLFFYGIALLCSPFFWFLPLLLGFLPSSSTSTMLSRRPYWWISFLGIPFTFLLWKESLSPLPLAASPFYPRILCLTLLPTHFAFPQFSASSWGELLALLTLFLGLLSLRIFSKKKPELIFIGAWITLSSLSLFVQAPPPEYANSSWPLPSTSLLNILLGLLFFLALQPPRLFWILTLVLAGGWFYATVLLWTTLFSSPIAWLERQPLSTPQQRCLIHAYQFQANTQKSLELLEQIPEKGEDLRLLQLRLLQELHRIPEQEKLAQEWIQEAPANPYPYSILAVQKHLKAEGVSDLSLFEKTLSLPAPSEEFSAVFYHAYSQALAQNAQEKNAQFFLEKAYRLQPDSPEILFDLAQLSLREEKIEDTLFYTRQILNLFTENLPLEAKTLFLQTLQLLQKKAYFSDALFFLQNLCKRFPQDKDFHFQEALLLQTPYFGADSLAKKHLQRLLQENSNSSEVQQALARVLYRQASQFFQQGFFEGACRSLQKGINLDPQGTEGKSLLAQVYSHQSEKYFYEKQFRLGLWFLEKAVHLYPEEPSYRLKLAEIFARTQRYREALEQYEILLQQNPQLEEAQTARALTLWKKGIAYYKKYPELAQAAWTQFLTLAPASEGMEEKKRQVQTLLLHLQNQQSQAFQLGLEYFNKGWYQHAIQEFRKAWEAEPRAEIARYWARSLVETQEYATAHLYFALSIEKEAQVETFYDWGTCYALEGNLEKAREKFLEALNQNANHALSLCRLGELELEQGQKAVARNYFQKGIPLLQDEGDRLFYKAMSEPLLKESPETQENSEK